MISQALDRSLFATAHVSPAALPTRRKQQRLEGATSILAAMVWCCWREQEIEFPNVAGQYDDRCL